LSPARRAAPPPSSGLPARVHAGFEQLHVAVAIRGSEHIAVDLVRARAVTGDEAASGAGPTAHPRRPDSPSGMRVRPRRPASHIPGLLGPSAVSAGRGEQLGDVQHDLTFSIGVRLCRFDRVEHLLERVDGAGNVVFSLRRMPMTLYAGRVTSGR
jgi:hypothetical protein